MSDSYPETPEAVAFELLRMITEAEKDEGPERGRNNRRRNLPKRADLLNLFAECLHAVRGQREAAERAMLN